jgi:hypothetical protein
MRICKLFVFFGDSGDWLKADRFFVMIRVIKAFIECRVMIVPQGAFDSDLYLFFSFSFIVQLQFNSFANILIKLSNIEVIA